MAGLNVFAIDAGTDTSKLGYADDLGARVIARLDGTDMIALREEAEIFCDEPVFSCVVAANSGTYHEDIRAKAIASGFSDVNIITSHEAMSLALGGDSLVCDFGASRCEFVMFNGHEVRECANITDICGAGFDRVFAAYLAERRLLRGTDEALLREARRLKHVLSESDRTIWHGLEILRTDFERLIYFSVKRAAHTAQRFLRVYKPERFILTGGCANVPVVLETFAHMKPEVQEDIITTGASLKARSMGKATRRDSHNDTAARLKELRKDMIELEDKLTRKQKDRIYMMFRHAEGINDAGIIAILESMIREIKQA